MARGDVLLVTLPPSDRREQSGRRPAVAVQTDLTGEPMLLVAPVTLKSRRAPICILRPHRSIAGKRTRDYFRGHGLSDESYR